MQQRVTRLQMRSWAALSQLIFIVIFRQCATQFESIWFVKWAQAYGFLRRRVKEWKLSCAQQKRTEFKALIDFIPLSFLSLDQETSQERKREITIIQFIPHVLIWRNRIGWAINIIRLNCIICITNTLIEKWIRYLTRLCLFVQVFRVHLSTFA